jgi:hypothetical protein
VIDWARVLALHWEERTTAIVEATLEVEHRNGDRQLFVIPILRMTDRMTGEMKPIVSSAPGMAKKKRRKAAR